MVVDDPRLAEWDRRMGPVVIAAAIVPIVVAFARQGDNDPAVFVDTASWFIFVADFVVHLRWQPGYLHKRIGRFDATVVALTFPWYLIPGLGNAQLLSLARLARLGRVLVVGSKSPKLRRLQQRVGPAAAYALLLIAVCAWVVYRVEPPSSGFKTYGDALWWGIVTFTTVGYGDLVPTTHAGRIVASFLMVGGIALIGLLAGSLSEFFTPRAEKEEPVEVYRGMAAELTRVRAEIAELKTLVSAGVAVPKPSPGEASGHLDEESAGTED